jgi:hypothetical protein
VLGTATFDRIVDRLCGEFAGIYSRETIERSLQESFDYLGNASNQHTFPCWQSVSAGNGSRHTHRRKERS